MGGADCSQAIWTPPPLARAATAAPGEMAAPGTGGGPQVPGDSSPGKIAAPGAGGDSPPESIGKMFGGREASGSATGVVASRRMTRSRARELVVASSTMTRSRARELALEMASLRRPVGIERGAREAPYMGSWVRRPERKLPVGSRKRKAAEVESGEREQVSRQFKTAAEAAAALDFSAFAASSRPLLPRYTPRPDPPALVTARPRTLDDARATCDYLKALKKRDQECLNIKKLRAHRENLPTMAPVKDPETAAAVVTSKDKSLVLSMAPFVVSVSSTEAIGEESILNCTGVIIGRDESRRCIRVVTSSRSVLDAEGKLFDPKPKLSVRLPNNSLFDGDLLFCNFHYGVAVLEVKLDLSLLHAPFVSMPAYGQEVFLLARDKTSSLMVRSGMILWVDDPYSWCNHYMHHDCDMPKVGEGGPVIDRNGKIIGITVGDSAFTVISIVQTCIRMWDQFSRIARPVLSMSLRSVELLDVSARETHSVRHGINKGFVARKVRIDSIAEKVGIRLGDVLVPSDEQCSLITTLPQLEDHLLSLRWGYLQGLYQTANVKITLHDPIGHTWSDIILPIWYSEALEFVDGLHG